MWFLVSRSYFKGVCEMPISYSGTLFYVNYSHGSPAKISAGCGPVSHTYVYLNQVKISEHTELLLSMIS